MISPMVDYIDGVDSRLHVNPSRWVARPFCDELLSLIRSLRCANHLPLSGDDHTDLDLGPQIQDMYNTCTSIYEQVKNLKAALDPLIEDLSSKGSPSLLDRIFPRVKWYYKNKVLIYRNVLKAQHVMLDAQLMAVLVSLENREAKRSGDTNFKRTVAADDLVKIASSLSKSILSPPSIRLSG